MPAEAWKGSDRKARLPADWNRRRKIILSKARYECELCSAPANEVDHIERGDDHSFSNLRAICTTCHAKKTSREAAAGRARRQAELKALTRRPEEPHPGRIKGPARPTARKGW